MMGRYFRFYWGRILSITVLSISACSLIFHNGFSSELQQILKLIDLLYSSIINLVIFLPSIAFVSFGLLPSVGINLKIKLVTQGELNSKKIEGVMDDLAIVFYLSVLAIGISICMKMFWGTVPQEFIDELDMNHHASIIILSFSIGVGLLLLVLERIWMIINTIHSILLGDFGSIEKEFEEVVALMEEGKITEENYKEVIKTKIERNLEASSIENIQKRLEKKEPKK